MQIISTSLSTAEYCVLQSSAKRFLASLYNVYLCVCVCVAFTSSNHYFAYCIDCTCTYIANTWAYAINNIERKPSGRVVRIQRQPPLLTRARPHTGALIDEHFISRLRRLHMCVATWCLFVVFLSVVRMNIEREHICTCDYNQIRSAGHTNTRAHSPL